MADGRDRRRNPRVRVRCPLRYRVIPIGGAGFRNALVQDVSQEGFRFRSQEFLAQRSGLLLEVHLPGSTPVRSLARAAWVREMPANDGFEVGGVFVEPNRETRIALGQQVAKHQVTLHPASA